MSDESRPLSDEEKDKAKAEAEKARAEAKAVLMVAETEAARNNAEARKLTAESEVGELMLVKARREEEEILVANKYYHVYAFTGGIDANSVDACIKQLNTWMRLSPGCPFDIVFKSPGGSVIDGMALFDFIQELRAKGHYVTTIALGIAASMAGILLQAGDKRVMGSESWVVIHETSFGVLGSYGQVEDTVDWVKQVQKRIVKIFASRSLMTERQIEAKWKRKDWYISSDECLKLGLVDEVR